jgi:glycosyltransferase involved in cell wall biosynthesis
VQHLHAHFAVGSATVVWVLARLLDLPFSMTAHAYDIWQDRLLLPEKLGAAKFVVTCTEHNREHLLATYPGTGATIVVVHHGVDAHRFVPADRRERTVPVILAVGRLCEQKGFATLLRACALLAQQGEAFECRIVGDGPLRAPLHALARELGVSTRVHFLGRAFQEQMPEHYAAADLFVLPCTQASDNDRDGIPNTLMEAMASGLPVVSTWFSGIPELVQHGTTGLLVQRDDSPALAAAMRRLVREPVLRRRLGAAGRERVVAEFSLARAAARLGELFGDMTLHPDSTDHLTEKLSA